MKQGLSISELAAAIERNAAAKRDYVVDTRQLVMSPTGTELVVPSMQDASFEVSDLAHRQICERLGIGSKYYDRMKQDRPALLAANVNEWFREEPERRLVRTLDGKARAFLSDRYQRIDNNHVAETVLPVLAGTPGIEVVSCDITDSRLYIKAVTHALRATVHSRRVGDVVEAGVVVSNSEVGLGAVYVSPFFNFLVCTNGMTRQKEGLKAAHIGTKLDQDGDLAKLLADDTRKVLDRGVLLKVRDVLAAAMDEARFFKAIEDMERATDQLVGGDPAKAIELLANDLNLTDNERGSVLRHLIQGGDLSRYGVMNAVTRTAEDAATYDRASELEVLGGRVLDLPAANWSRIAEAA